MHRALAVLGVEGFLGVTRSAAPLNAMRHAVEHLDALDRVFAHAGLAAEHDGVGLFKNSVGHVGHFRAGGHRVGNHGLEHVRGHDHRAARAQAAFDNSALDDGQFFHGTLDAEIAAGHHDDVALFDNAADIANGELVFDLGDDPGMAAVLAKQLPQRIHVTRFAAETQRHHIHTQFRTKRHVLDILFCERRQIHLHAGEIDVPAGAKHAGREHAAAHPFALFLQDFHVHDAVVHEHGISHGDVIHQAVVIDIHRILLLAPLAAHGELNDIPRLEVELGGEIARANGRPLRVHQNADHCIEIGRHLANARDDGAHPLM